jgi:hypothetical protein
MLLQEELSRRCCEQEVALQYAETKLAETEAKGQQLKDQLDTSNRNAEQLVRISVSIGIKVMHEASNELPTGSQQSECCRWHLARCCGRSWPQKRRLGKPQSNGLKLS